MDNVWKQRHDAAMNLGFFPAVRDPKVQAEQAMVHMLRGFEAYSRAHKAMYDSTIGEDHMLGPAWEQIGHSLRTLLNGELGRLDGGSCDRLIADALTGGGYDPDVQGRTVDHYADTVDRDAPNADAGMLRNAETHEAMRAASLNERDESSAAETRDDPRGVIKVDGVSCYVDG